MASLPLLYIRMPLSTQIIQTCLSKLGSRVNSSRKFSWLLVVSINDPPLGSQSLSHHSMIVCVFVCLSPPLIWRPKIKVCLLLVCILWEVWRPAQGGRAEVWAGGFSLMKCKALLRLISWGTAFQSLPHLLMRSDLTLFKMTQSILCLLSSQDWWQVTSGLVAGHLGTGGKSPGESPLGQTRARVPTLTVWGAGGWEVALKGRWAPGKRLKLWLHVPSLSFLGGTRNTFQSLSQD